MTSTVELVLPVGAARPGADPTATWPSRRAVPAPATPTPAVRPMQLSRDQEAQFETFVTACRGRLVGAAFLLTGDRGHAEDLVQTVLATCCRYWPGITAGSREAYVRTAIVNTHISSRRRRRPREIVSEHRLDVAANDDAVGTADNRDLLRRALHQLPARTRAAVVLRYYAQLTETETASAMSCSVGNVKSLTYRGLRQLREILGAPGQAPGR